MKSTISTVPVIVSITANDLRKEYGLTPSEAKKAMGKLSSLHAKRKTARKVTRVKGPFTESYFD